MHICCPGFLHLDECLNDLVVNQGAIGANSTSRFFDSCSTECKRVCNSAGTIISSLTKTLPAVSSVTVTGVSGASWLREAWGSSKRTAEDMKDMLRRKTTNSCSKVSIMGVMSMVESILRR